jgi:hypothetical protein
MNFVKKKMHEVIVQGYYLAIAGVRGFGEY